MAKLYFYDIILNYSYCVEKVGVFTMNYLSSSEKRENIIRHKKINNNHFSDKYGFYRLFWLFLIGSFLGVVIEVIFCMVVVGHYESRVGLVYLPLNLLYGFGTLFMSLGLHWARNKNALIVFLGGFVIGSIYEYFCSWFQQYVFGSVSWKYDALPLNLNGRINVLFSCFWGVLAILWVKVLEPLMSRGIHRIPNILGKPLTWILLIVIIIDAILSIAAVWRWGDRLLNIPVTNSIEVYLDKHFPNDRLERIYPNMDFIDL